MVHKEQKAIKREERILWFFSASEIQIRESPPPNQWEASRGGGGSRLDEGNPSNEEREPSEAIPEDLYKRAGRWWGESKPWMVPGTAAIPELASWGDRLENVRRFFPRIKVIIVLFLWRYLSCVLYDRYLYEYIYEEWTLFGYNWTFKKPVNGLGTFDKGMKISIF